MGIYLGQLPPAEIARFKAELAETIIANFCYPRFFDYRANTLHCRPVDRTKRQEVWLYLSSVDFTLWGRVDLMSADLQLQIERLFIQFVQRNRSFFGNQGRRRMSDVRTLISSCAGNVAQSLRSHLSGQRTSNPPFGSPRPVVSWAANPISGRATLGWDQISASTQTLQQQLQELRGELKSSLEGRRTAVSSETGSRRSSVPTRPQSGTARGEGARQAVSSRSAVQTPVARSSEPVEAPVARKSGQLATPIAEPVPAGRRAETVPASSPLSKTTIGREHTTTPLPENKNSSPQSSAHAGATTGVLPNPGPPASARDVMTVGEDDRAIFEQMRHQLLLWLRIEAVTAGLEISGQGPTQLLELLRQQSRLDETRLQVVSTLLNLANQVIKNGVVSVLDYKQALMFHLMHTRRM